MFPSQTSLIPVTVALVRFFEANGPPAFTQDYPYWYLGSTPYKFLIGPVLPFFSSLVHMLVPHVSLFNITIYIVLLAFILSAIGWGVLVALISKNKVNGYIVSLLLLLLPWRYLAGLAMDEGSLVIAKNLLPFALVATYSYLSSRSRPGLVIGAIVLLLLINTDILPQLVVSSVALCLAASFNVGKIKGFLLNLKHVLILVTCALLLVTFWYSPGYWLTILFNPSIGGVSAGRVILRIIDLLKGFVPIFLAIASVYFAGKVKTKLGVFTSIWLGTFIFLTIFRFIGDPDFWMDWTSWMAEVEIGLAILLGIKIYELGFMNNKPEYNLKSNFLNHKLLLLLFAPFIVSYYIYGLLGKPQLLSRSIPEGVRSFERLNEVAGGKTVFLSGSTVFWANALYDIYQVRGGRDQVAIHPTWDRAAFEIREGDDPDETLKWLKNLDISYILVHKEDSKEYYHDFKNLYKWQHIGRLIWQVNGDYIYSR